LRADRLGVAATTGRPAARSPHPDAIAERGTRFTHVWAQAPNTPRSFPSLVNLALPVGDRVAEAITHYSNLLPSNHTFL